MKTCIECGTTKEYSDFYKNKIISDGHAGVCKECHKERMKKRRHKKAQDPKWAEAERARTREKFHRLYSSGLTHTKSGVPANLRRAVNTMVSRAVKAGILIKPDQCSSCGRTDKRIEGHHSDYTKPLEVEWLCSTCHKRVHLVPKHLTSKPR